MTLEGPNLIKDPAGIIRWFRKVNALRGTAFRGTAIMFGKERVILT